MTPTTIAAIALLVVGVAIVAGCVGWVLHEWSVARSSRKLNDEIRDTTARTYASTPDGRNADRMPADRYASGG